MNMDADSLDIEVMLTTAGAERCAIPVGLNIFVEPHDLGPIASGRQGFIFRERSTGKIAGSVVLSGLIYAQIKEHIERELLADLIRRSGVKG